MTGRPTPNDMPKFRPVPRHTASRKTTAQEHLNKCILEALREFDAGGVKYGVAAFSSNIQKHSGTENIARKLPFLLLLASMGESTTREQFEKFLRGFHV